MVVKNIEIKIIILVLISLFKIKNTLCFYIKIKFYLKKIKILPVNIFLV